MDDKNMDVEYHITDKGRAVLSLLENGFADDVDEACEMLNKPGMMEYALMLTVLDLNGEDGADNG